MTNKSRLIQLGNYLITMHCVIRELTEALLSAAVKVQLGFKNQSSPKWPLLTMFSKINCPSNLQCFVKGFVALIFVFLTGVP